jgi:hypothetical protein
LPTGSKAFTETLRRYVAGGSDRAEGVFKYFNNFDSVAANALDVRRTRFGTTTTCALGRGTEILRRLQR